MLLIFKSLTFPLVLSLNLAVAVTAFHGGLEGAALVPLLAGFSFIAARLTEMFFPLQSALSKAGESRTDWTFLGVTAAVDAAVVGVFEHIGAPAPSTQADLLAFLTALVVWEFGGYWAHRLGHEWPQMWKFHALHHAPQRMIVLNNFRIHPIDLVLKDTLALGALGMCGFDATTLALVAVTKNCVVAFQHADADLRHGWLNKIFSTNTAHRWHHSADPSEGHSNYGSVLLIWDAVFGTLHVASDRTRPKALGLYGQLHYPTNQVLRSILSPFCWQRCTTPPESGSR